MIRIVRLLMWKPLTKLQKLGIGIAIPIACLIIFFTVIPIVSAGTGDGDTRVTGTVEQFIWLIESLGGEVVGFEGEGEGEVVTIVVTGGYEVITLTPENSSEGTWNYSVPRLEYESLLQWLLNQTDEIEVIDPPVRVVLGPEGSADGSLVNREVLVIINTGLTQQFQRWGWNSMPFEMQLYTDSDQLLSVELGATLNLQVGYSYDLTLWFGDSVPATATVTFQEGAPYRGVEVEIIDDPDGYRTLKESLEPAQ